MTSLVRWNPFPRANAWPFDFWGDFSPARPSLDVPIKLGVDVRHNEKGYSIEASLPGFNAENIDVTIDDGVLRIAATKESDETQNHGKYLVRERRSGKFYRALRIPDSVDVEGASTSHKNGVLTIELPKSEVSQPKRLQIAA